MTQIRDKEELIIRIRTANQDLERVLDQVPEEQAEQPNVAGTWSAKQILLHVIYWQETLFPRFQTAVQNSGQGSGQATARAKDWLPTLPVSIHSDMDVDAKNHAVVDQHRTLGWQEARAKFRRSTQILLDALETVPQEALMGIRHGSATAWDAIPGETYEHYEEHRPEILLWLQPQGRG